MEELRDLVEHQLKVTISRLEDMAAHLKHPENLRLLAMKFNVIQQPQQAKELLEEEGFYSRDAEVMFLSYGSLQRIEEFGIQLKERIAEAEDRNSLINLSSELDWMLLPSSESVGATVYGEMMNNSFN